MAPSATTSPSVPPTYSQSKTNPAYDSPNDLKLLSSGGPIDPNSIGRLRPTDLSTPLEEIRERYAKEGYVWLKGLLPAADIWKARQDYFEFLQPTGLLGEGTDPKDGIYCGGDWRLVCTQFITVYYIFPLHHHNHPRFKRGPFTYSYFTSGWPQESSARLSGSEAKTSSTRSVLSRRTPLPGTPLSPTIPC
jgi:hypothetical protein